MSGERMKSVQENIIVRFNHFITFFVVPAVGHTKIMAKLKERKGSTVWDHFTIEDLVYSNFLLKNHEDSWSRNFELKRMDLSEQEKYKKHKILLTADK